jgi:hypothetical protein
MIALLLTGCGMKPKEWISRCELKPRMEGRLEINHLKNFEDEALNKFRLYLRCPT